MDTERDEKSYLGEHRFAVLLAITIVVTSVLTTISMALYNSSGAAQLDLSRPGYRSVSDKIDHKTEIDEYSSSGPINVDAINQFIKLYDEQSKKATEVDAFNGDPLNPEVLEFNAPSS